MQARIAALLFGVSSAIVAASCGGSTEVIGNRDGGAPDVSSQEASAEDASSPADAGKDISADDARPDAGDDTGGGEAADADSGSGDSGDNAAVVGSFAEFGNGSFLGDATYHADGTATWTGGGSGTWKASGNTITAHGSNAAGASWTDIVTLSADGTTLTGQNTGGVQLVLTRWTSSPAGQWSEVTGGGAAATVTYYPGGTVIWAGSGSGTWKASGNAVTAVGNSGMGASWTDMVTLSADGTTMTGKNTGGVSISEVRQ
jgi:hypothetical protein